MSMPSCPRLLVSCLMSTSPCLPLHVIMVRCHFHFKAKQKRNFFASMRKKCFFRLFRIDGKHRNLYETKRKQNEKEAKTAIIFALKQNGSKICFTSMRKKCFFACFASEVGCPTKLVSFRYNRNWN
jgi:hypothetical protein